MRQIILDTETTGLEHKLGHRIVEIAAMELCNRQLTGNYFHYYLNPERKSDDGALQVHGLTTEFLRDKPKFSDIAKEFLSFISDAALIIHNAPFDTGFINHELKLAKLQTLDNYCHQIIDTLKLAKEFHPGKRNNLDALCERYKIDNSKRSLHGALLDAELLSEVYLAMTRGQESLLIDLETMDSINCSAIDMNTLDLKVLLTDSTEIALHRQQLNEITRESNGRCIWSKLEFN